MTISMSCKTIQLVLVCAAVLLRDPASAHSPPAPRPHDTHRVVFVCEHGSVKSLIATLYFNQRAQVRGLPYVAVARGIAPDLAVPSQVRKGLRASGFDVSNYVPKLFQASDVSGASLVVSFDQDISREVGNRAKYEEWDNLPGVLVDYARGRDALVSRVEALITRLEQSAETRP